MLHMCERGVHAIESVLIVITAPQADAKLKVATAPTRGIVFICSSGDGFALASTSNYLHVHISRNILAGC